MKVSKFVIFGPNTSEHHNTVSTKLRNGGFTRIYGSYSSSTLSATANRKNVWFIDVSSKTYMYETLGVGASSDKLLSWGPVYDFVPQSWSPKGFKPIDTHLVAVQNVGSLSLDAFLTKKGFKFTMGPGEIATKYINVNLSDKTMTTSDLLIEGIPKISFALLIDAVLKEEEKLGITTKDYGYETLIEQDRIQKDLVNTLRSSSATTTTKPVDHTIVVYTNNAQTLVFHNIENFAVTSTGFSFDYKGKLTSVKRHAVFNNTSTAGYALADE